MTQNVLFIVSRMPMGGAETFLNSILKQLDKKVIQPVLFSLGSENDPMFLKVPEGIPKFVRARKWRYDFSPCRYLKEAMTDQKINTAVCTDYFTYFYLRKTVKTGNLRIRFIVLLHVTRPRYLKEFLQGFIFARMLTGTEEIITTCENQKKYLSRLFRIPERHLATMIYNGVDTDYWTLPPGDNTRSDLRSKFGIPPEAMVLINVAGFRLEKRHDIMVKALNRFYQITNDRNAYLLFVGGGDNELEARIKAMASKLAIRDRVIFAGIQDDLRSMYWMSDIFTLGSTSETFSIAALEAMSTGLPCVLTNVGGANEMITEKVNGFIVKPGSTEALAGGWAKCSESLQSLKQSQIRDIVVRRFRLEDCVKKYEEFLTLKVDN